MRFFDELVQTTGAIEQGILGVQVQMDKVSVRHGTNLTLQRQDTKAQLTLLETFNIQGVFQFFFEPRNTGKGMLTGASLDGDG
jgi:hypothetical protein